MIALILTIIFCVCFQLEAKLAAKSLVYNISGGIDVLYMLWRSN